jgi:hypothetical protein
MTTNNSEQFVLLNQLADEFTARYRRQEKMRDRQITELPRQGRTEPDLLAPAPHYTLWRIDKSFAVACARRLASARE